MSFTGPSRPQSGGECPDRHGDETQHHQGRLQRGQESPSGHRQGRILSQGPCLRGDRAATAGDVGPPAQAGAGRSGCADRS